MREYLLLLTKYNKNANDQVIKIIDGLTEEERISDRGSFAISLHGILDHIVEGSLYFQKQIWSAFEKLRVVPNKYIGLETVYGKVNFEDYTLLSSALKESDEAFIAMYQYLSDEELVKEITVKSFHGDSKQSVCFIMLQYINHCTHHRGQISQILDQMGVTNDYSGIHLKYD
jgi:uncharacterized damage-inducible protein DinB